MTIGEHEAVLMSRLSQQCRPANARVMTSGTTATDRNKSHE